MAHFTEGDAKGKGVFCGKEGGSDFCLSRGAHHVLEYFTKNMDDSVAEGHGWVVGVREVVAEEKDASCAATSFRLREVGSVTVDVEDHVAWVVANGGDWMRGSVVEEVGDFSHGEFCRFGLGCGDCAKGDEHREVDGDGIVEEGAHDALDGTCS